jgi:hypothetical protein
MANNPNVEIITNSAVGAILGGLGIAHTVLEGRAILDRRGVAIEAFDGKHEEIFEEVGQVQNTGYLIANRFFYPGDSFHLPLRDIEILALPIAGPWCRIGDAIRYALDVKPKRVFPVHDAVIKDDFAASMHTMLETVFEGMGLAFIPMKAGVSKVFDTIAE